jgi:carboxyl-terminal processing protease
MKEQSRSRWSLLVVGSLLLLCLCLATGSAAYYIAQQITAAPGREPVTVLEITRAVTHENATPAVPAESENGLAPHEESVSQEGITSQPGEDTPVAPAESPGVQSLPTVPPPTPTLPPPPLELDEVNLELFYEVWQIIERDFDGDLPGTEQLLHALIAGSLETLDDEYTRYVPPQVAARMRQDLQGSFEGIGAFVRMTDDGFLQIVRPMSGQPAARAGLLPQDLILAVDGISVTGMDVDEAIALVRGPRGTAVVLTVLREDVPEPFDVTVVREQIEIPIIEAEMLPDNIAYVRLSQFNRNAQPHLQEALEQLLAQNPEGLVLDLRDNPGGFLDQAVAVSDLFLDEGVVLLERNRRGMDEVFRSRDGGVAEAIPLVVLINAGSASASEIVAGAIQDRGRAILIGETSFGKGSVQQTHTLSDGSELRVTFARWFTPNNHSIDQEGIVPDIEVLPSPMEFGGPEDTQLQRAVEYLLTGE